MIQEHNAWWDGLSISEKSLVMYDRMTRAELRRHRYRPITPDTWWSGKNETIKELIYQRLSYKYPIPKPDKKKEKSKSRSSKNKRGEKK